MFRTLTTATESLTGELELTLETLKDLTVTGRDAHMVRGGFACDDKDGLLGCEGGSA